LAKKTHVVKGNQQNELFHWLTHEEKNGWCNQQPVWNFSKYLVNEAGTLTHFFANTISPLDSKIVEVIN
jgi:glutathione peroxidase